MLRARTPEQSMALRAMRQHQTLLVFDRKRGLVAEIPLSTNRHAVDRVVQSQGQLALHAIVREPHSVTSPVQFENSHCLVGGAHRMVQEAFSQSRRQSSFSQST